MSNPDTAVKLSPIVLRSFSGDREVIIDDLVKHIDLWESMLVPVITCTVHMVDGIDLLNSFPIIGEETIEFSFSSQNGYEREVVLQAVSVEDKEIDESRKSSTYTMRFASPELLKSNRMLLSKKYKDQASAIIEDIMGQLGSKNLVVEETKGIEDLSASNLKPLQVVDWIRARAISPRFASSSYCFYENRDGFNFRTMEGIFAEKKSEVGDRVFWFDNNTAEDRRTVSYRNILAHEHTQMSSPMELVANGGIRNRVTKYDLITGAIETVDYEDKPFESADPSSNPQNTKTYADESKDTPSVSMFLPWDSTQPASDTADKLANLQAFAQKISQNILRIWIPGDSSLTVGDVIECKIPSSTGLTKESEYERLLSGNYLVAKCRHMITVDVNSSYTQSLELVKGSLLSG